MIYSNLTNISYGFYFEFKTNSIIFSRKIIQVVHQFSESGYSFNIYKETLIPDAFASTFL